MTDSMVERVAEAIMKVDAEDKISDYYKWARAAIAAMREPTEAMIDAMIVRQEAHDGGLKGSDRDVFIAAIDEALK